MSNIRFLVPPGRRIWMLILTYIVGFIVTSVLSGLLLRIGGQEKYLAMLRIATILQDILLFIVPALLTAFIVTPQPVKLLALEKIAPASTNLVAVAVLMLSSPLMQWVIELNEAIHLPESMASVEAFLRNMENVAGGTVDMMLGPDNVANLIINILIIGVMAGFSEEIFFRGALQRLLATGRTRPWVAVWISAIIFSAVHMQFFGFFPRMLLGAFFGYMLLWSGSIWLPMMLHMLNNSLFVILHYSTGSGEPSFDSMPKPASVAISAALTAAGLWWLWRNRISQPSNNPNPKQ